MKHEISDIMDDAMKDDIWNEILSPEDAFWYADKCECCERETFIQKELNKLSPDHARSVKAVLMFNLSSLSKPTVH